MSSRNRQIQELEQELEVMGEELSAALEAAVKPRSPSSSTKRLVNQLRTQLEEKEQQMTELHQALQHVRADLVETAQKTLEVCLE